MRLLSRYLIYLEADVDDDGCEGVKMRERLGGEAATEVSVGSRPPRWAHLG